MSLILDALRKSERTRQQSLTGKLGAAETPAGPSRLPIPWLPIIAAIVVVNVLLLAFLWPRNAPAPSAPAPTAAAAPAYHPAVRPLAGEAAGPEQAPAVPAAPIAPAGDDSGAVPPAPAPAASVPRGLGAVQSLDDLPADFRQSLPRLHMDVHGYAVKPADRFVVINLKQYRIGDTLADGPVLKDIVPQGAVLEYHGTTFLLPAN
jgi:hypothetical protein